MTEAHDLRQDEPNPKDVPTFVIDKLNVQIYPDREAMGNDAAEIVGDKLIELLADQDFVNVIFAAAPSQNEFFASLIQNTALDWNRVNAFHMDEYIGLPENTPQTFASFLDEKIFGRLAFKTVNYINGNAVRVQGECERYAALLRKYPPDIVCMGIGENGHLAFNDPPVADFNDREQVKIVELDAECRQQQVNDGCFSKPDDVPTHAITLTIPALMAGRYVYCMVPGIKKVKAVFNTLNQEIVETYPSTILRRHADAVLFLDKESSSLL